MQCYLSHSVRQPGTFQASGPRRLQSEAAPGLGEGVMLRNPGDKLPVGQYVELDMFDILPWQVQHGRLAGKTVHVMK